MQTSTLFDRINKLPEQLQHQVADFVDFLSNKYGVDDSQIPDEYKKLLEQRYEDRMNGKVQTESMEAVDEQIRKKYGIPD